MCAILMITMSIEGEVPPAADGAQRSLPRDRYNRQVVTHS